MNQSLKNKKIILASKSPRRHALIKKLNVDFDTVEPAFDEKLDSDVYSDEKIQSLSLNKAMSVLNLPDKTLQNSLVVSADTVVVLDNKILGKPKNEAQAIEMLKALSDKKHFVVTALTVADADTKDIYSSVVKTYVTFQKLSDKLIFEYVKTKKPLDKAGAYGIQEMDEKYIKQVDGDIENVIGLPTNALRNLLIQAGYVF